jgi:hypothetical protein
MSEPELSVVDIVDDFENFGATKESREEARWGSVRWDMLVEVLAALEVWPSRWTWVSLEDKARALRGVVWWSVIGNVVLGTMTSGVVKVCLMAVV